MAGFTIGGSEKGLSLIDALAVHLGLSKKKCKALLDTRNVLVNERPIWMARHQLRAGDKVEVVGAPVAGRTRAAPLRVLFENERFLIMDKPAGILSNGATSLEEHVRKAMRQPDIVAAHRLDKSTSGCLLLARDPAAFEAVVAVFRAHRVRKAYHAVVAGRLSPPAQRIDAPIGGARAVTQVKTLKATRAASHLLIKIETGRTHQIRKHLAGLGHPILGDRQYGLRAASAAVGRRLPRHMLHASRLQFADPVSKQDVLGTSPLPEDFRNCLRDLKLR